VGGGSSHMAVVNVGWLMWVVDVAVDDMAGVISLVDVDVDAVSANMAAAGVDVTPIILPLLLLLTSPIIIVVALRSPWTWRSQP